MIARIVVLARELAERDRFLQLLAVPSVLVSAVPDLAGLQASLEEQPCDLVFLRDDTAPVPDVLEQLRLAPGSPDLVVLTSLEDGAARAELLAAGVLGVVSAALPDGVLRKATLAFADRRRRQVQAPLVQVPDEAFTLADYVTGSERMKGFLADVRRVATHDTTLLLLGETGVGKGLLARSIHNEGARAQQPFVAVNCGAFSENLLESELFGHEKGAFTGAIRGHRGHFELAHGGTLFLDEVSELSARLQAKLLRVLEDRVIQPVGSERSFRVDVRVIAATNRELAEEARAGRFRRDLFYRLNVVSLEVPPLRERVPDIPELAQSYVEHFRNRFGAPARGFSPEAVEALCRYAWPGNIRELVNTVERAVLFAGGTVIELAGLPEEVRGAASLTVEVAAAATAAAPAPESWLERPWRDVREEVLAVAERRYLEALLADAEGRIGEVAVRAGMDPRSLFDKLRRHGLRKEDFRHR